MKINRYNESIRDKMTGKSENDIRTDILKLTPYGILGKLWVVEDDMDYDLMKEIEKTAKERAAKSEKELDDIFKALPQDEDLKKLVPKVEEWIKKYGGNAENIEAYGYTAMAEQIWRAGVQWSHDVEIIYDKTVFKSFRQLLKDVAICETKYNNLDYEHY